ncbi:MAG TPA: hypothetical protein VLZ12_09510, partial [Verrucomicrobiae bacterium]|nr:hypothetical protein [Verrucomicrobiae bacterium]
GTDPANPASALRITSIGLSAADTQVTFSSAQDKSYTVESTDRLQPPKWTIVTQNVAGTSGAIQIIDASAATNSPIRHYRVRLVP